MWTRASPPLPEHSHHTMAPANLQGLNIVHRQPPASANDAQDILSSASFPDLAAQLDLWTNLAFETDEPIENRDDNKKLGRGSPSSEDIEDDGERQGTAPHDSHDNVVVGRNVGLGEGRTLPPVNAGAFDLNTFLAGFGIDPYLVPQLPQPASISPSLAQLLTLHSAQYPAGAPQAGSSRASASGSSDDVSPPQKRVRTRKTSIASTVESPEDYADQDDLGGPNTSTPLIASEDKRRRNTAASARFRLKKKEREAALEKKAKEMEGRVNELERECEGLRRENGWLKGLVVGVTGGAATASPPSAAIISASAGAKRTREEVDGGRKL